MRITVSAGRFARTITALVAVFAIMPVAAAAADAIGPIDFEGPGYSAGTINGQNDWLKTGSYDVAVESVGAFPDATGYGFGAQALHAVERDGQRYLRRATFSPARRRGRGAVPQTTPGRRAAHAEHLDASFKIGTTSAKQQSGLKLSVDRTEATVDHELPGFEDQADGVTSTSST